jgi:TRAP-type mannitol/chloroaromatic compound transport system permease small subunit
VKWSFFTRLLGYWLVAAVFLFLFTRYLTFWLELPSIASGIKSFWNENSTIADLYQIFVTVVLLLLVSLWVGRSNQQYSFMADSHRINMISTYLVRFAFWSVFLIGLSDAFISFLRVENLLDDVIGESLSRQLNQPRDRGLLIHYPLISIAAVIALFTRSLGFIWLTFLVVFAEFLIVLSRFIFSYEQAFMGDLVRFWYAALFLFASAYTLLKDGHVRVDLLFAGFTERSKALVNGLGSLFLGIPVCFTILWLGMGTKQSSLVAPLLNFEVSQSGYGMYVKYLMSVFLVVFAVTMAMQFIAYYFACLSKLSGESAESPFSESGAH